MSAVASSISPKDPAIWACIIGWDHGIPLYEYACHEGNYALSNILSGERHPERMEAEEQSDSR